MPTSPHAPPAAQPGTFGAAHSAEPITLAPTTAASSLWLHEVTQYSGRCLYRVDRATGLLTWNASSQFGPRIPSEPSQKWNCFERMFDSAGRKWSREFQAVMDDFGMLVEVGA